MAADLHELAVAADKALERLATGLASAGVDEQTVQVVNQCADVTQKIVSALGKGQAASGDNEPAEGAADTPAEEAPEGEAPQGDGMDAATNAMMAAHHAAQAAKKPPQ